MCGRGKVIKVEISRTSTIMRMEIFSEDGHVPIALASVPGRFFFNRTKLKNTSRRPSVQLETDRPGVEATIAHAQLPDVTI